MTQTAIGTEYSRFILSDKVGVRLGDFQKPMRSDYQTPAIRKTVAKPVPAAAGDLQASIASALGKIEP